MGKKGAFFYAVRKGFQPGVYSTWDECKSQVDKFPYASYKKFALEKDAWEFVRSQSTKCSSTTEAAEPSSVDIELPKRAPSYEANQAAVLRGFKRLKEKGVSDEEEALEDEVDGHASKRMKPSEDKPPEDKPPNDGSKTPAEQSNFTYMGDAVVVYTDGCCEGNGKTGARAGIGVYWGPNHPLNVAEKLHGRQTNQRAEIVAACKALEQAKEMKIKKLVLYTDSKFTINGVNSWVSKWKVNGWRLKGGGTVINKEDFQRLDALNQEVEVVWQHIPGHAGFAGNEEADRLSRLGAAKSQD
ncbi:ribonuclease H1 isoform X2 [Engraulis encrasicolus]